MLDSLSGEMHARAPVNGHASGLLEGVNSSSPPPNALADVETHIQAALKRGNSPYTLRDVLGAFWRGDLRLLIASRMTASLWIEDGRVHIVHVGGEWNHEDARWLIDRMKDYCRETGKPWTWSGRKGWVRFLRMKGFKP